MNWKPAKPDAASDRLLGDIRGLIVDARGALATMPNALNEALGLVARKLKQTASPLPLSRDDEFEVELAARIQPNFEGLGV